MWVLFVSVVAVRADTAEYIPIQSLDDNLFLPRSLMYGIL